MTVLFLIDYVTQGGAIRSFLEMVVALQKKGVCPIVCTSKHDKINTILDQNNIENMSIGHKNVLRPMEMGGLKGPLRWLKYGCEYYFFERIALKKLEKKIDFSKIDLIHTNSARNILGCLLNKRYNIPHVMHIREFGDVDFNCVSFRLNYIKIYNQYTTKFLSISEAVKHHWVNKGINEEKVQTIYNGIHFEDVTISSDNMKKSSDIRMLIAGGVYPTKGQHFAVEAIGLLPEDVRNHVSLDVVGWYSEKYVEDMKKHAASMGYANQIHFLGSINDVHERMGNYQIGLMCSHAEGFGRVTAEYMHGRLGVIASDSGANPELIEDGVTGLLFKSGDAKSLADCILKLYNDRELLIKLSNAALKKARELYTQQKNADAIYEVYKQVLNK